MKTKREEREAKAFIASVEAAIKDDQDAPDFTAIRNSFEQQIYTIEEKMDVYIKQKVKQLFWNMIREGRLAFEIVGDQKINVTFTGVFGDHESGRELKNQQRFDVVLKAMCRDGYDDDYLGKTLKKIIASCQRELKRLG